MKSYRNRGFPLFLKTNTGIKSWSRPRQLIVFRSSSHLNDATHYTVEYEIYGEHVAVFKNAAVDWRVWGKQRSIAIYMNHIRKRVIKTPVKIRLYVRLYTCNSRTATRIFVKFDSRCTNSPSINAVYFMKMSLFHSLNYVHILGLTEHSWPLKAWSKSFNNSVQNINAKPRSFVINEYQN